MRGDLRYERLDILFMLRLYIPSLDDKKVDDGSWQTKKYEQEAPEGFILEISLDTINEHPGPKQ